MNTKTNDWKKGCQIFFILVIGSIYFSEISAQDLPWSSYRYFDGLDVGRDNKEGPFDFYGKVPVISSFSFDIRKKKTDRHFGGMMIDTDPFFGRTDRFFHTYEDQSVQSQDRYQWQISLALIDPNDFLFQDYRAGDCPARRGGVCYVRIPDPPEPDAVFVLKSFELKYTYDDHHIEKIGIFQENSLRNFIHIRLYDKDQNDPFEYAVSYAYLPRSMFIEVDELLGSDDGGHTHILPIASGIPVIRGFEFEFKKDDHHIDAIKVNLMTNGTAQLAYRDKNADDDYDYIVKYAVLPRP